MSGLLGIINSIRVNSKVPEAEKGRLIIFINFKQRYSTINKGNRNTKDSRSVFAGIQKMSTEKLHLYSSLGLLFSNWGVATQPETTWFCTLKEQCHGEGSNTVPGLHQCGCRGGFSWLSLICCWGLWERGIWGTLHKALQSQWALQSQALAAGKAWLRKASSAPTVMQSFPLKPLTSDLKLPMSLRTTALGQSAIFLKAIGDAVFSGAELLSFTSCLLHHWPSLSSLKQLRP